MFILPDALILTLGGVQNLLNVGAVCPNVLLNVLRRNKK